MTRLTEIQDFTDVPGAIEKDAATIKGIEVIFNNIIFISLGLAGIVFFFLLLIGGFKFMTSGGDPKAVESARNTLTFAILGLVLITVSFLILRFIQEFTGIEVTKFTITE